MFKKISNNEYIVKDKSIIESKINELTKLLNLESHSTVTNEILLDRLYARVICDLFHKHKKAEMLSYKVIYINYFINRNVIISISTLNDTTNKLVETIIDKD